MPGSGGAERSAENPQARKDPSLMGRPLDDLDYEREILLKLTHTERFHLDYLGTKSPVKWGESGLADSWLIRVRGYTRGALDEIQGRMRALEGEIDIRLIEGAESYERRLADAREQLDILQTHQEEIPEGVYEGLLKRRIAEVQALNGMPKSDHRLKRGLRLLEEQRKREQERIEAEREEAASLEFEREERARQETLGKAPTEFEEEGKTEGPGGLLEGKSEEKTGEKGKAARKVEVEVPPLAFPRGERLENLTPKIRDILIPLLGTWGGKPFTKEEWTTAAYEVEMRDENLTLEKARKRLSVYGLTAKKTLNSIKYEVAIVEVKETIETNEGLKEVTSFKYELMPLKETSEEGRSPEERQPEAEALPLTLE